MKRKDIYMYSSIYFFIDLISKLIIKNTMNINESIVIIKKFFNIHYVHNYGAAFSIMINQRIVLILVALLCIILINKYILIDEEYELFELIIYSSVIGGILGNLFDRIVYGYVIDFLSFNIFGYKFPIFNLADIFITVGAIMLIVISLGSEYNERNKSK